MNLVFASGFLVPQHVLPQPILGAGDYFRGLKELFEPGGKYFPKHKAIFPSVEPVGSSASRAQELARGIPDDFAAGGFHIIAHSMGGLDSRTLILNNPNGLSGRIKSLTTISTPHNGTVVADLLTGRRPQDEREFLASIADVLATGLGAGAFLGRVGGALNIPGLPDGGVFGDIAGVVRFLGLDRNALEDLTTVGAAAIPDPIKLNLPYQIRYRSYAAVGRPPSDFHVIQKQTCLLFVPFHIYIKKVMGEENDGLVPLSSSNPPFGDFQGEWQCDHADAVGYDLDAVLCNGFKFDHLAKYDAIITDLERLFPG